MRDGHRLGSRRALAAEVRVLAHACATAGALAGFHALVPFSATAPTRLCALLAAVGLALGAGLWWVRDRVTVAVTHAVVVLATLCVTACVAASTTPAGVAVTALGFVWVALFAAVFHRRGEVIAHVSLVLAGLAGGLVLAGATSPLQTWVFVGVTTGVVATVVHRDVSRLRDRADLDGLTGALTRTAFRARTEETMDEARRRGEPLTLVLVDLDDFKLVNDSHGHAAGDRVLTGLTHGWRPVLARGDLLGRHGGDEFVLVLRSASLDVARGTLARMRAATSEGTWTAGLAAWSGEGFEEWLALADADLYRRKRSRPRSRAAAGA
jgi:diguanylate cyclase